MRFKTLNSPSPCKLKIICLLSGYTLLEKKLHKKFKSYHIKNEWFEYTDKIKKYIDKKFDKSNMEYWDNLCRTYKQHRNKKTNSSKPYCCRISSELDKVLIALAEAAEVTPGIFIRMKMEEILKPLKFLIMEQ